MSHPGVDTQTWAVVLSHRPADERAGVIDRFVAAGVEPGDLAAVLADGGDALYTGSQDASATWADRFGGPHAVALLAAEVSALAAHVNSRASVVRSRAVGELLDDYSAVTVAAAIGVSRQKVYDIGRPASPRPFITQVPWRRS